MYFALLINADETAGPGDVSPEDIEQMTAAVDAFDKKITDAGQNLGSIRLQPSSSASTVKVRGSKKMFTDGPFAETKEQIGGIWLIEAEDQNEANEIAADLPTATFCTIEVRPIQGVDLRKVVQAW